MKIKNNIFTLLVAGILTACSSDDLSSPAYTVGEADNAIVLGAGIAEGGSGVTSRAVDGNHSKHVAFSTENKTQLRLRVDGKWRKSGTLTNDISYATTATTGEKTGTDNRHNKLSFSPMLYWDDYGTADPENMSLKDASDVEQHTGNGRGTGLTIYGVGVNEKNLPTSTTDGRTILSTLTTSENFKNITWNVGNGSSGTIDQSTTGWGDYDLITSNNIKDGTGFDGTLKFDDTKQGSTTPPSNLLEFTHAMSKITVVLTAGEGFDGYATDPATAKFKDAPKVTLLGFNYTGTVDVEDKTSTPPTTTTIADIKAWRDKGATWTTGGQHTSEFTALVFPGNSFTATIQDDAYKTVTSSTNILKLDADGNVFYVTAAELVKAIAKKDNNNVVPSAGDYTRGLKQGVNYILNIKVNKTKINVEATIKDWDEIDADEAAPVINISANYGQTTTTGITSFDKSYDFFRSTNIASGYDDDNSATGINPAATFNYSGGSYNQSKVLYWPNHDIHYFFRGVYPIVGTASSGYSSPETSLAITTNSSSKEVIEVSNVAYNGETWPSDLAIALPRTTNTACTNHSKTPLEYGICATTGTITMNFEYAMSKVEVRLKSSANPTDKEYVDLANITVEVVGGYNKGRIALEDGLHDAWVDSDKGNYTLNQITAVSGFKKTTLDAIIPQILGDDVKFKITVNNSDGTTDIYYAQLNLIKGKKNGASDDTKAFITEWKHGEYYVYELTVTKTEIKVAATITDWTTVNAEENVWF